MARRTREIGVRVAPGARTGDVVGMLLEILAALAPARHAARVDPMVAVNEE